MSIYQLPHFGKLDLNALEGYYEAEFEINSEKAQFDLNFEGKSVPQNDMDCIKDIIDNIEAYNLSNKRLLFNVYTDGTENTVEEYIAFHLEEVDKNLLATLINFEDESAILERQLLDCLKLVRTGFYPDGKFGSESFAVFDYSIGKDITDQIIAIKTDKFGNLNQIDWES